MGLKVRFFLGYAVNSEIKSQLYSSILWNQDVSMHLKNLELASFEKKEYIGQFTILPYPNLKEMQQESLVINHLLENYCPELRVDKLKFILFPQFFIG